MTKEEWTLPQMAWPTRRVAVQITAHTTKPRHGIGSTITTALCNDGTIWQYEEGERTTGWYRLKDIPQETP